MTPQKLFRVFLICVVMLVISAIIVDEAYAGADLEEKKGIEGLFKKKDGPADPRAPNFGQKALGIGAFVVTVIVMKYL